MSDASDRIWFEFVESKIFSKQVREPLGELIVTIQLDLVQNPERGDIVKGTHGVRKARVADPASCAEREAVTDTSIFTSNTLAGFTLLYLFGKGEQADLSPEQKRIIGALSQAIRKES